MTAKTLTVTLASHMTPETESNTIRAIEQLRGVSRVEVVEAPGVPDQRAVNRSPLCGLSVSKDDTRPCALPPHHDGFCRPHEDLVAQAARDGNLYNDIKKAVMTSRDFYAARKQDRLYVSSLPINDFYHGSEEYGPTYESR